MLGASQQPRRSHAPSYRNIGLIISIRPHLAHTARCPVSISESTFSTTFSGLKYHAISCTPSRSVPVTAIRLNKHANYLLKSKNSRPSFYLCWTRFILMNLSDSVCNESVPFQVPMLHLHFLFWHCRMNRGTFGTPAGQKWVNEIFHSMAFNL